LIADLRRDGLAPATIRSVLVPVNRVIEHGARRGILSANPVKGLEKHERPSLLSLFTFVVATMALPAPLCPVVRPTRGWASRQAESRGRSTNRSTIFSTCA
jgi:hypothetical protein